MPQNEYIEEAIKKHGRRLDYEERKCVRHISRSEKDAIAVFAYWSTSEHR